MNFEETLAFALGQKDLEIMKLTEQVRMLQEELEQSKKKEEDNKEEKR